VRGEDRRERGRGSAPGAHRSAAGCRGQPRWRLSVLFSTRASLLQGAAPRTAIACCTWWWWAGGPRGWSLPGSWQVGGRPCPAVGLCAPLITSPSACISHAQPSIPSPHPSCHPPLYPHPLLLPSCVSDFINRDLRKIDPGRAREMRVGRQLLVLSGGRRPRPQGTPNPHTSPAFAASQPHLHPATLPARTHVAASRSP
jgi:hypothetical protein